MSTLIHGTADEKWAFVFKLIDVDCDGEITSTNLRSYGVIILLSTLSYSFRYLAAIHCLGSIEESTYRAIGEQLGRLCKVCCVQTTSKCIFLQYFNLVQPSSTLSESEFVSQMLSTQANDQLETFVATI